MDPHQNKNVGGRTHTDEIGNTVLGAAGMGGAHGTTGGMPTEHQGQGQGGHVQLPRSGSGSSSSSEDDGQGGRRKKGLTEKIKEKLPGGKKTEQTTTTPEYAVSEGDEKKGIMDKIKEKLPGQP